MYIHNLPALHFLSCVFRSFLGLSLRLFRWFLRLVYLPGLSSHSFLPLSFSPALLALLFLFFLLSFRRLFRRLFRFLREGAAKRPSVCVCHPLYQRVQCHCFHCHRSTRQGDQACHIQPGPTKLGCDRGSTRGRFGVYLPQLLHKLSNLRF